ncbi:MAG: hypothetical protein AAF933_07925 [Pseudomonadota bacterium]
MKYLNLTALVIAFAFLAESTSAVAATPMARAYTVDGWSYAGRTGGSGGKSIRHYIGPHRKGVTVSMTGFRAEPLAKSCFGKDPDRCYGTSIVYREVNETSAYIRDQRYNRSTGWLEFTVVVVQQGRVYAGSPSFYWKFGYAINAFESN